MRTKKRGEERKGRRRRRPPCLALAALALADPPHQDMLRYFFLSFLLKLHNYRDHRSSNLLDKRALLLFLFKIRTGGDGRGRLWEEYIVL